jgi:hypothetical protein
MAPIDIEEQHKIDAQKKTQETLGEIAYTNPIKEQPEAVALTPESYKDRIDHTLMRGSFAEKYDISYDNEKEQIIFEHKEKSITIVDKKDSMVASGQGTEREQAKAMVELMEAKGWEPDDVEIIGSDYFKRIMQQEIENRTEQNRKLEKFTKASDALRYASENHGIDKDKYRVTADNQIEQKETKEKMTPKSFLEKEANLSKQEAQVALREIKEEKQQNRVAQMER